MSEYYNVVPWFNSKEWNKVYMDLYSPNSTDLTLEDAFELLHIWKARSPILPSGIESTLTLLEVRNQDIKSIDVVGEQIIRLAYSTALMRFVNHMLDSQTSKGSSLYTAAHNLGVPDWIIDLRHDTAHGHVLPSIELLREATSIGLDWLKVNYWDEHKKVIEDYICGQKEVQGSDDESKIQVLMNFCFSLSICAHSKLKIERLADIPNDNIRESMKNDIQELFGDDVDVSNLKKITMLSLINLIDVHSKRLLKSKNTSLHVNESLLGKDSLFLSMDLFDYLNDLGARNESSLSKHYVHYFEILLTYLHINDLLENFVMELIKITQNSEFNSQKRWLAALWTSEILKALKKSTKFVKKMNRNSSTNMEEKDRSELKSLFYHWFPNEKGCGLLLDLFKPIPEALTSIDFIRPVISTYNVYLTYFVKDILNLLQPPLPDEVSLKICELATLIGSNMKKCNKLVPRKVFTIADVKMAMDEQFLINIEEGDDSEIKKCKTDVNTSCMDLKTKALVCGIWKLEMAQYGLWTECPIGIVPADLQGTLQDEVTEPMDIETYQ